MVVADVGEASLMKCVVRNKIPQTNNIDPVSEIIRKHYSSQKTMIKAYAASKCYVKPCDIAPGDIVLMRRPFTTNKGMSVYNSSPMTVVRTKGSMITATNADTAVSRNSSFFKKLIRTMPGDEDDTINTPPITEHREELPNRSDSPKANIPHLTPFTLENPTENKDLKPSNLKFFDDKGQGTVPTFEPKAINEPPALRRSTRRRIPRKILDLQSYEC